MANEQLAALAAKINEAAVLVATDMAEFPIAEQRRLAELLALPPNNLRNDEICHRLTWLLSAQAGGLIVEILAILLGLSAEERVGLAALIQPG